MGGLFTIVLTTSSTDGSSDQQIPPCLQHHEGPVHQLRRGDAVGAMDLAASARLQDDLRGQNGGTQKLWVYFMENPIKMDDDWGYPYSYYLRKPLNLHPLCKDELISSNGTSSRLALCKKKAEKELM